MQLTKFQIFTGLFFIIFFVSCNEMIYNNYGFGGGSGASKKRVTTYVSKIHAGEQIGIKSIDFDPVLFDLDTLTNQSTNLIDYSNSKKIQKLSNFKLKLFSKLVPDKLPKSQFVEDYGNWLKKSFPKKTGKVHIPNQINKNLKIAKTTKANYNEDTVEIGLYIAGISAGLLLIIILIGTNTNVFRGSEESLFGCLITVFFGLIIIVGLLVALIGAIF